MNNREIGSKGEDIACDYLIKNGYKIIDRNVHFSRFCEVDIIAEYKNKIIFAEVKTRSNNNFGTPFEAITPTKYNNIKTGALNYIKEKRLKAFQIDVIGITLQPEIKIEHLKNV